MKTLKGLPKDEQLRYLRDQDFKGRVEWNSVMGETHRKGLKEGLKEGLDQGLKKGSKETAEKIVLNMLNKKCSTELISEVTGLSEKEIQQISLKK